MLQIVVAVAGTVWGAGFALLSRTVDTCMYFAALYGSVCFASGNICHRTVPVASLGLVSPGAASDGVTPIFPEKKTDDLFSHRHLQSDDLF